MMQNSPASLRDTGKTDDSLLLSKTLKFLVVLIILFASTQLGLHFWPISSLVYGIRIDYLSPTLYFLDILILLYLGLKFRSFGSLQRSERQIGTSGIGVLLPILLANLLFSQNPLSTLNWSFHLLLYCSFIVSLKVDTIKTVPKILLASLFFQLLLGLVQAYLGHSLGGFMYYLGERMVAVGSPGIATTPFMGQVVLRAYGAFSHPNILAGWSIIVLLIILKLRPQLKNITVVLSSLIVFLADSRSAILTLFGFIIPFHLIQRIKSRLTYFVFLMVAVIYFLAPFSLARTDLSFYERLNLQWVSLKTIPHFPLFGAGAQASISTYPLVSPGTRLLQPDHNSFTLFLSWFGAFGVLAFLYILKPSTYHLKTIFPILPLLLLDHYLLTSPQGLFVLLFYLTIAVNYTHAQKDRK